MHPGHSIDHFRMQSQGKNAKVSKELNLLIDPFCRTTTSKLHSLFRHPLFTPRHNISLDEERRLALERLQSVCSLKIVSVMDFERNPLNIFTVHEVMGMVDGSAATKFTVQFNLFGGTLLKLANPQQREMVKDIDNLKAIGCFALTELGYGNNAVEMETTAEYVQGTNEVSKPDGSSSIPPMHCHKSIGSQMVHCMLNGQSSLLS